MTEKIAAGVLLADFCAATDTAQNRVHNLIQKDQLPFEKKTEGGKRRRWTGEDAFAFAIVDTMMRDLDTPLYKATSIVLASNCVNEFYWRKEKGFAVDGLLLAWGKERDEPNSKLPPALTTFERVIESREKIPVPGENRCHSVSVLLLHHAFVDAVRKADANGFILADRSLIRKEKSE